MKVVARYSHLNGEEHLVVHKKGLLEEIESVINKVDAEKCKEKVSKEKTMRGKILYSPPLLNKAFKEGFDSHPGWESVTYRYCVTTDRAMLDRIATLPLDQQRDAIRSTGVHKPLESLKQTDFVKNKVAVEVQFGKYAFVAYDLFVKHMLFYSGYVIDVGIEILPMKSMLIDPAGGRRMSTGIAYYEGEVYNVLRHGRSNPPVPLLILGIKP